MARFETEMLTTRASLNRLMDLSGRWIDNAHRHRYARKLNGDLPVALAYE